VINKRIEDNQLIMSAQNLSRNWNENLTISNILARIEKKKREIEYRKSYTLILKYQKDLNG
jgi:hypothetical protein